MKLFGVFLIQLGPNSKIIHSETDLSSFGYFQRSSVLEFMNFFSKTIAERTPNAGQRQSVEQQEYLVHVHTRTADLSCVVIADKEYPPRVAFALIQKVFDEFLKLYPQKDRWNSGPVSFPALKDMLAKYQDPNQADDLMKIQKDLDETKIIMHKTIQSVLERGEQLDKLVEQSDELSAASKVFLRDAQSNNSCCRIM